MTADMLAFCDLLRVQGVVASMALAFFGCATPLPPAPAAADPCEGACARRASLGCLEFPDVCVDVCHRAERAGLYSPACVVAAETREALEACRVRCAP